MKLILRKDIRQAWKKLIADYVIHRIEKKDVSLLIAKGLSILPNDPEMFFNMKALTPITKEFIEGLYKKSSITLYKNDKGHFQAVLDSAKPRQSDNLVSIFKCKSMIKGTGLYTITGNGFKPILQNGKWTIKVNKVFSIQKSEKKVANTIKEILSTSLKDSTFLTSNEELELFKKAKLIKVNEKHLCEISIDKDNSYCVNSIVELKKFDNEKRLVYGVVYEPNVVDADGHEATPDVIEETAHGYLEDFSDINLMHERPLFDKVKVVESYIAPTDFNFDNQFIKKGSWVLVVKVYDDNIWEAVKGGVLNAFSLEGKGIV